MSKKLLHVGAELSPHITSDKKMYVILRDFSKKDIVFFTREYTPMWMRPAGRTAKKADRHCQPAFY